MKKSKNENDLLAAIQRKTPPVEDPNPSPPPASATTVKRARIGKPLQVWMHDEDRRILRELSAWLAGQGVRASDSLVIRTALRSAKIGDEMLKAFHESAKLDGRLKQQDNTA
jgi:hypothetical protein